MHACRPGFPHLALHGRRGLLGLLALLQALGLAMPLLAASAALARQVDVAQVCPIHGMAMAAGTPMGDRMADAPAGTAGTADLAGLGGGNPAPTGSGDPASACPLSLVGPDMAAATPLPLLALTAPRPPQWIARDHAPCDRPDARLQWQRHHKQGPPGMRSTTTFA